MYFHCLIHSCKFLLQVVPAHSCRVEGPQELEAALAYMLQDEPLGDPQLQQQRHITPADLGRVLAAMRGPGHQEQVQALQIRHRVPQRQQQQPMQQPLRQLDQNTLGLLSQSAASERGASSDMPNMWQHPQLSEQSSPLVVVQSCGANELVMPASLCWLAVDATSDMAAVAPADLFTIAVAGGSPSRGRSNEQEPDLQADTQQQQAPGVSLSYDWDVQEYGDAMSS